MRQFQLAQSLIQILQLVEVSELQERSFSFFRGERVPACEFASEKLSDVGVAVVANIARVSSSL